MSSEGQPQGKSISFLLFFDCRIHATTSLLQLSLRDLIASFTINRDSFTSAGLHAAVLH